MFLVFSVSIAGFEQVKSWLGSNIQLSKSRDTDILFFVINVWFISVRGESEQVYYIASLSLVFSI